MFNGGPLPGKGQRQELTAGWRYRLAVGTKAERRAASERVAAYHEARLGELIEYITAAIDRYRAGEIDAYTVDETIHHYHRAARELWKFCWSGGADLEYVADTIDHQATEGTVTDWWQRGAPRERDLVRDALPQPSPQPEESRRSAGGQPPMPIRRIIISRSGDGTLWMSCRASGANCL